MKLAIFLICLISYSFAATTFSFSGNVTKSQSGESINAAEFAYRHTAVWAFPINIGIASVTIAGYASAEVKAQAQGSNGTGTGSISGDFIIGAIKFATSKVPVSYMGYISAKVNATASVDQVTGTNNLNYDYSAAAGYIITSFNRIEERTSGGSVVRSIPLSGLVWNVATGNSSGGLHYITLQASNGLLGPFHLKSGEVLSFTFLVSEVLGQVTVGAITVPVTPKSLESIVEIHNWQYGSTANHLALVGGVATGAAVGASTGQVTIASGSGNSQVYAHFSGSVDVNGKIKSVKVTAAKSTSFNVVTDEVEIKAQADAVYKGNFNINSYSVEFPAGASSIIYDPTIGAGKPVVGSAQTTLLFTLLLAIVVLLI